MGRKFTCKGGKFYHLKSWCWKWVARRFLGLLVEKAITLKRRESILFTSGLIQQNLWYLSLKNFYLLKAKRVSRSYIVKKLLIKNLLSRIQETDLCTSKIVFLPMNSSSSTSYLDGQQRIKSTFLVKIFFLQYQNHWDSTWRISTSRSLNNCQFTDKEKPRLKKWQRRLKAK
jgi:hypothetical protein